MGFQPARAVTIRVDPDSRYKTREQRIGYLDEMLRRVKELPGVEAAGATDALPLGRNRTWGAPAKGVTYERGRFPFAFVRVVSDGYPAAMDIPLRAGWDISASDTQTSEPVIMINETMARTLWPGQDPLGKYVMGGCGKERRVVGVVGDVRHLALEQASGNEMYLPMRQCPDQASMDLVVRSALPPSQLAGAIRAALQPIAGNMPGNDFRTLQQLVDKSVSPRRFLVLLLGGFAAFALVLASLGIYGLISYSVGQRTQEIGIRMALGASARDVQSRIIMQTLWLSAIGIVLGTIASWAMVQGAGSLLFGVEPRDPGTFLAMVVVLTMVALIAGYLPARRASRIDPMVALRAE
jgi:predicted permease